MLARNCEHCEQQVFDESSYSEADCEASYTEKDGAPSGHDLASGGGQAMMAEARSLGERFLLSFVDAKAGGT